MFFFSIQKNCRCTAGLQTRPKRNQVVKTKQKKSDTTGISWFFNSGFEEWRSLIFGVEPNLLYDVGARARARPFSVPLHIELCVNLLEFSFASLTTTPEWQWRLMIWRWLIDIKATRTNVRRPSVLPQKSEKVGRLRQLRFHAGQVESKRIAQCQHPNRASL